MTERWMDWDAQITHLQARLMEAERLLAFCVQHLACGDVHHEKHEYHAYGEVCPVMTRLRAAITTDSAEPAHKDWCQLNQETHEGCCDCAPVTVTGMR
jgi:hypothetical protein